MAANSFVNLINNKFDRNFGGSVAGIADPYITGYHFIKFEHWPLGLDGKHYALGHNKSGIDGDQPQQILQAACLSVTPPGGTLNKTEFTGLGGIKWAVPTNIDYGNTVTVKFLEYSHLPILSIIHGWFRLIRDYRTGTTELEGVDNYTKSNYSASMLYATTKPDAKTIEYYAMFTGMFPAKDPQDLYTSDLTAVDKLEIDIEFNCDWTWHEDWVYTKCENMIQDRDYHMTGGPGVPNK